MLQTRSVCALAYACAMLAPAAAFAQTTHLVPAGGQLQAALDAARGGDTILLEPGATYSGNFRLPVHGGATYVTVRSAAPDDLLPAAGQRITPAWREHLPRIVSANGMPPLRTAPGAAYWRLQFLELGPAGSSSATVLDLGDGTETSLAAVPHHLIVDRVYVRGHALDGQRRGIGLHGSHTTVINSYVADIKLVGQDSQAIGGWNGPGPFHIENNYLEGAGEVVMFGGDDPRIPSLVPSDIVLRGNTLTRPVAWRQPIVAPPANTRLAVAGAGQLPAGTYAYRVVARRVAGGTTMRSVAAAQASLAAPAGSAIEVRWDPVEHATEYLVYGRTPNGQNQYWKTTATSLVDAGGAAGTAGTPPATGTVWQVKNLFELKNARRVLADYNILEHNWEQAQTGAAVLFTPRNQYGRCTWCVVEDVVFEHNVVRRTAGGMQLLGWDDERPSAQASRLTIRHNQFSELGKDWGSSAYVFSVIDGPRDVTIDHNTIVSPNGSGIINADKRAAVNFVFTNNVARHNAYGIIGTGTAIGLGSIDRYFPGSVIQRNAIAGGSASKYPAGNLFPSTAAFEAHFVDYPGRDYSLIASSSWRSAGTDGIDLGADIPTLTASVVQPIPPVAILTPSLPAGLATVPYAGVLEAAGGTGGYAWAISGGGLPPGMALTPDGRIEGTALAAVTSTVSVTAVDTANALRYATRTFSLTVGPPPNRPPAIAWSALPPADRMAVGATVPLTVLAGDPDGTVTRVDFYVDDLPLGTAPGPEFTVPWFVSRAGRYTLRAVAVDDRGAATSTPPLTITPTPEVVLYGTDATRLEGYEFAAVAAAVGGIALWHPNQAAPKIVTPSATPEHFAEFTFFAEAGRPYHIWIRGRAQWNDPANDSVHVQFDGVAGARIGTTSSKVVNLEDDALAGVQGWGWQDTGYGVGVLGTPVVFETTGPQTLRLQPREDGMLIDQIVISPERYLLVSPGLLKRDATVVPK